MFDTPADQADGLRRVFRPRPPSVVAIGCGAPATDCRRYAATVADRLERTGSVPTLVDRIDAPDPLGALAVAPGIDRVLLLEEPVRLARWLDRRLATMLLLLSHQRDALPPHYATIKAISLGHGVRRFAVLFVDAPGLDEATEAHDRLATCARRFLGVEILPMVQGAISLAAMTDASLARLPDFEIAIVPPPIVH